MIPNRLIWRIFLPFLAITSLAIGAVSIYTNYTLTRFYQAQTREYLVMLAKAIGFRLQAHQAWSDLDKACKQLGKLIQVRITIITPSGRVLADSQQDPNLMEDHATRPEVRQAMAKGIGWSSRISPTLGIRMVYVALSVDIDGLGRVIIRTAITGTAIDRTLSELYRQILSISLVAFILAIALSWILARQITGPISMIQQVANGFSKGRLDLRAPQSGPTEVGQLARAFNEMADLLQERITTVNQQRAQLEAILATMVEALIAVDKEGNILAANLAAGRFMVTDVDKAFGRHYCQVIGQPQLQEAIHQLLSSCQGYKLDHQIQLGDGTVYLVRGARLLQGPSGTETGAVLTIYDITELRRLEQVRKDFVANVSHELKTPITTIKGFIEALLESDPAEADQVRKYLQIVARHTDRLNAIIDDLLTLTRLEEEQHASRISREQANLHRILESSIELTQAKASEKAIKIELTCDQDIVVKVNPTLLQQAVINLLDNAIKYSDPGQEVHVRATQADDCISIQVIDHGCGIPAEHLDRIFERFYVVDKARSRQLGGTGLGLAIVKHIVQLHQGTIEIESQQGKGSTFTILLPVAQD